MSRSYRALRPVEAPRLAIHPFSAAADTKAPDPPMGASALAVACAPMPGRFAA
jgi:hypothetical protein